MSQFFQYLTREQKEELEDIANSIVVPGKGILASDEPPASLGRRFDKINVENTEENRRRYRQLLYTADKSLGKYLGGIIMHPDAFYMKADDGELLSKKVRDCGIVPGVNVDKGLVKLPGNKYETTTQGLDGLSERCAQFKKDGAGFTKLRCALVIKDNYPSHQALLENANVLARFASISQQNGLVPFVEPQVLMDGDHDLHTARRVTEQVLSYTYHALMVHHVFLEGTILKPNMVTAGESCTTKYTPEDVARATVEACRRAVPTAVPGIAFLSGGLSEEDSTLYLKAINSHPGRKPWALTFCFGRALQSSVLAIWSGDEANVSAAQKQLLKRAQLNGEAVMS